MLQSFWNEFVQHVEKTDQKNPIIHSILKELKPLKISDSKIIARCENQGVKIYLEKKISIIEHLLLSYLNKKTSIEFILEEKKRKKEPPLLRFEPSMEDIYLKSGLHAKYRFDNFAVSSTNQVAYAAAQAVSRNLGTAYNPLFLYGGVGVGKTHLAQAVGRTVLEKDQSKKIFFCPGDQFTNELIESIRERSQPKFRKKYRSLKMIIVDDIQFIAGKQTVQEEFFHTFNTVASAGGQIILTSDKPPREIKNLEDRLRSRFSGGLIVDLQPPDFELRTAILLIKAKEKNIEIDMEAAKIIAQEIEDSRALEGALLSVYTKILGIKEKIDLEAVEMYLQERTRNVLKKVSHNDVIRIVCSFYNIRQTHIKSSSRQEEIVLTRQIIMYLLRIELKMKFDNVADILKRKDHTTIMHGVEKITALMIKNPVFKQEVDRITQTLTSST